MGRLCTVLPATDHSMLSYKEYDNAQAVEIVLTGRVSTEEFDKIATCSDHTFPG
jgi:hypothetical protein